MFIDWIMGWLNVQMLLFSRQPRASGDLSWEIRNGFVRACEEGRRTQSNLR